MKEKYTLSLVITFAVLILSGLLVFVFAEGYVDGRDKLQEEYDAQNAGRAQILENAGVNRVTLEETFDQMDEDNMLLKEIRRINRYIYTMYLIALVAICMAVYMIKGILTDHK